MDNCMDVTIIIVNYNTIKLTIDAINSIREKTSGIKYEVIVVDNNSSDDSANILKDLYQDEVICISLPENVGFGRANNEGFKIGKGRNILFLNPDVKLINNAILILSEYLDAHPNVGACGGNLFNEELQPAHSYRKIFPSIISELNDLLYQFPERVLYGKGREHNASPNPQNVAYITGADLMIRKTVLEKVGCFDPAFFMYYEETELCRRIYRNGYRVVCVPQSQIQHLEGKSFDGRINERRISMSFKSRNVYYKRCYSDKYKNVADCILYLNISLHIFILSFIKDYRYEYWKMLRRLFKHRNDIMK